MNLSEQVLKIKNLIYELSPQSEGVQELIQTVIEFPELLKHMGFSEQNDFKEFIADASYEEFSQLDDIWSKLENTESNEIKKGEMKKVVDLAKKYNKTKPVELRKLILSGDYRRPLIIKFGDRYHLVAGNTRLCTAAALGVKPKVLIGQI